jgi:orotate phosphoribosyltransferase
MEGQSVVLLDDVLTTGGSLLKTYSIVSEFAKVKGAIVVVNREDIDISTLPINIISLYTRSHILEAA